MSYLTILLLSTAFFGLVWSNPANSRVVGGSDAIEAQFPYQISLRYKDSHICGGSIISTRHVLTAAHCVGGGGNNTFPAESLTVLAGTINRIAGGIVVPIKRIEVHPGYKVFNDIAVLELEKDLIFSDRIQPIELFEGEVPEHSNVTISGWGLMAHGGANIPIILQYTTVNRLSTIGCFFEIGIFSNAILCLSHAENVGACNGDSGGPATYNGKLVGVANFVFRKCGTSKPDGYAKVSYFSDWIRENTK